VTRDRLSARYIGTTPPPDAKAGAAGAVPLVLVHGFTQTGASWSPVLNYLRERAPTLPLAVPDAPGHGGSSSVAADLWQAAQLLSDVVDGPASWAGYSMGARMVLHLAFARPDKVKRLVLISGTAGIDDAGERKARREHDETLARKAENVGTAAFVREWLAQPLFSTLPPDMSGADDRLANIPAGLASSLRLAGTGSQQPLWGRLGELGQAGLPVLVVAGSLDGRYLALAERIAGSIGSTARLAVVEGAGHACHLERPAEVATLLAEFCS